MRPKKKTSWCCCIVETQEYGFSYSAISSHPSRSKSYPHMSKQKRKPAALAHSTRYSLRRHVVFKRPQDTDIGHFSAWFFHHACAWRDLRHIVVFKDNNKAARDSPYTRRLGLVDGIEMQVNKSEYSNIQAGHIISYTALSGERKLVCVSHKHYPIQADICSHRIPRRNLQ